MNNNIIIFTLQLTDVFSSVPQSETVSETSEKKTASKKKKIEGSESTTTKKKTKKSKKSEEKENISVVSILLEELKFGVHAWHILGNR